MVFGYQLQLINIVLGGLSVVTVVVFTMLVGMRKIKFKGRRHLVVHKTLAWMVLALGAVHGTLALAYLKGWKILS